MAFIKKVVLMFGVMGVAVSEPQSGPANTYLPPDTTGYQYNRPSIPFPSPAPGPQPTPGRPVLPPTGPPRPPTGPTRPPTVPSRPHDEQQHFGEPHHAHDHHEPGMPFDFNYAVKDDYFGTDYSHNAISDGEVVKGEYRVQLPDGRLQIVKYTADWKTGFHADIHYEGQASYPENNPGGYNYNTPSAGGGGGSAYGPPAPSRPGY